MPEMLEIEVYRRAAERVVGRRIAKVHAPDAWYLKEGLTAAVLKNAVEGRTVAALRRHGKLLLVDTESSGPTIGLRFGMTGRLLIDGTAGIEHLEYSSLRENPDWDRIVFSFAGGGELRIRDPRRLGGVLLDPSEERLGPDALSLTPAQLRDLLATSRAPVKARLMDQSVVAGIGNLLVDEALWRAGIDPARESRTLTPNDLRRLHKHLQATLVELGERGGSHTGDLQDERRRDGVCPKDGTPLLRRTVGGRTTYSCPKHQL
ncbi:MAG TPA: DNA-formamidopyrimidine glycosylase family protein [Acidimicrobiales bacterium]|nr:DNA-formamidopyrimidine glycosylase family protein [Acidimicrobiales bacterium]